MIDPAAPAQCLGRHPAVTTGSNVIQNCALTVS